MQALAHFPIKNDACFIVRFLGNHVGTGAKVIRPLSGPIGLLKHHICGIPASFVHLTGLSQGTFLFLWLLADLTLVEGPRASWMRIVAQPRLSDRAQDGKSSSLIKLPKWRNSSWRGISTSKGRILTNSMSHKTCMPRCIFCIANSELQQLTPRGWACRLQHQAAVNAVYI